MNQILEEIQDNSNFSTKIHKLMKEVVTILEEKFYWKKVTIHNSLVPFVARCELVEFYPVKKKLDQLLKI